MIVPDAQLDLHRIDLGESSRFIDLPDRDVAEADRADETVAFQLPERADARGERRSWIGSVELVEVQARNSMPASSAA
jgi:hypothetical protein